MVRGKKKASSENPFIILEALAGTVDALFVRYTGKTIRQHLEEPQGRPRELPRAENVMPAATVMPLEHAYAILGLKPDAPMELVKKHYRNLANVFHTDKGGMNEEAMKLINRAYDRITKGEE
ncbi:hypothetical protein ES703_26900 [subsurface metagenome]